MEVEQLADGLWWWTGGDAESLYVESVRAISLLDPVLPPEDRERFLRALDRDVARHGGPVHVFFSAPEKRARAGVILERYDAVEQTASTPDVEVVDGGFVLPGYGGRRFP